MSNRESQHFFLKIESTMCVHTRMQYVGMVSRWRTLSESQAKPSQDRVYFAMLASMVGDQNSKRGNVAHSFPTEHQINCHTIMLRYVNTRGNVDAHKKPVRSLYSSYCEARPRPQPCASLLRTLHVSRYVAFAFITVRSVFLVSLPEEQSANKIKTHS